MHIIDGVVIMAPCPWGNQYWPLPRAIERDAFHAQAPALVDLAVYCLYFIDIPYI